LSALWRNFQVATISFGQLVDPATLRRAHVQVLEADVFLAIGFRSR